MVIKKTRTRICGMFNNKYPNCRISRSIVSRIENKYLKFGSIQDIPMSDTNLSIGDEKNW